MMAETTVQLSADSTVAQTVRMSAGTMVDWLARLTGIEMVPKSVANSAVM